MKKTKVLLIAAALFGTIGAFVSCADYESDYERGMTNQVDYLMDSISGLDQLLKQEIAALQAADEQFQIDLAAKTDTAFSYDAKRIIDEIEGVLGLTPHDPVSIAEKTNLIDSLSYCLLSIRAFDTLYRTKHLANLDELLLWHDSVSASVTTAKSALLLANQADSIAKKAEKLAQDDSIRIDSIDSKIDSLNSRVDTLVTNIYKKANEVLDSAKAYTDAIRDSIVEALGAKADTMQLNELKQYVDSVDSTLTYRIDSICLKVDTLYQMMDTLKLRVDTLYMMMDTLKARMDTLEWRVDTLEWRVDTLENRMDSLVTGIIVQGVENPLWGMVNTPFGIKANLLVALCGETGSYAVDFPATGTVNYIDASEFVNFSSLNPSTESFADGEQLISNAGKLYLTVNPNDRDFSGTKMALVNSMDEMAAGFDSITLEKCDTVALKFGFGPTKAASDNGFYIAEAVISDADAAKMQIDRDALQDAASKFLHDKSKDNLINIVANIYEQLNYKLDANAVKCSWTDLKGTHSIYSEYSIAATAFQPLSFGFMKGASAGFRLPLIPNIETWLANHGVTVSNFTYDPMTNSTISFDLDIIDNGSTLINPQVSGSTITIDGIALDVTTVIKNAGEGTHTVTIPASSMATLISQVNNRVGGLIDQANTIVDSYHTAINMAQNEIINKVNNYINKINGIIGKDLNSLLQITMLFENGEGSFSQVNAVPGFGSKMKAGNTAKLYLTSYTAELLAPAYKKYIAVISGPDASVNSQENFNTVLDGSVKEVEFTPSVAGEYEIAYSAMDYSGKITTRKFYIDVQ